MTTDVYEMIRRHEGLRLKPYRCPAGALTIGYGRNLDELGVSRMEAEYLLANDVSRARAELLAVLPEASGFGGARFDALTDMMYNLGSARFSHFRKMLEALRAGDFAWAAKEMLDSTWAHQVGGRAEELANLVREG